MTRYAVALGSNLGDRLGHLRAAIARMGEFAAISDVAGLYETAPMGGPEQGPYLNSVAVLETDLAPAPLLDALQSIETSRGRERVVRWGPRSLDLDIVAMAPGSVDSEHLVIPHPRAVDRRFVVEPLCEVWPEALVTDRVTASEALSRLGGQDVDLLDERWVEERPRPDKWWVTAQFALFALIGIAVAGFGTVPTAAWSWWRAAGGLTALLGVVMAVAAARWLGAALTAMPEPIAGSTLIDDGLYGMARHPIYGGLSLVAVGISVLFAGWAALALSLVLISFFWLKSDYEERRLRIAHPGYAAYRRRVRFRLIPFLL
jgi:2-amino-4-hydroxy-6-hydroxymethyldihydropteridine diphosphokinase